jgi:nucleoside-diphosphate-sugar epimerase/predicted lipid carrier protein YhbT
MQERRSPLFTQPVVFLTGGTGALGSWIARKLLEQGLTVRSLARGSAHRSSRQRMEESLLAAGVSGHDLSRLRVVEGNILHPRFGMSAVDWSERVGLVIHCAASTAFDESASEATRRTNVQGLLNVLAFARERQAPFVHVSTAYVAGKRTGRVHEHDLDEGQAFHNTYEQSKCCGEALVRQWAADTGLPTIVLRPSIVLGDARHGRALRFNTVYDLMRTFDLLGAAMRDQALRVVADERATKNIVPVDYFADLAWRIIRAGQTGTYHIVHPRALPLGELRNIFAELFGCEQVVLVSREAFARQPATAAERACHRAASAYRPYMTAAEPLFDRSATDAVLASGAMPPPSPPKLNVAYFRRLLEYARSVNWGRGAAVKRIVPAPSWRTDPVQEYFDVFLSRKIGQRLLPDLHRMSSAFGIRLVDTPREHWGVEVRQGVLHSVLPGPAAAPCRFQLNVATFLEVVAGRLTPQRAFFHDRIQIEGDQQAGLRIAAVFGPFFRRFPFAPSQTEGCAA